MKNLKDQKGITLVALVVTIIVLLILAGVSLSLVAGGNGILDKATNAADKTNAGAIREQVELAIAEKSANYYEAKYVNRENIQSMSVGAYISASNLSTSDGNYTIVISSNKGSVKNSKDEEVATFDFSDDGKMTNWVDVK